jgi:hypothetical protein
MVDESGDSWTEHHLYRMKLPLVTTPPWLLNRFQALYRNPPHYEASYYGPVNALLNVHFPAADGFLVKPQARLRQPPKLGGRTSIDSVGQLVGTFDDDGNPDFLVSYGSAQLHQDVPLLIYEVKTEGMSFEAAAAQLDRYITWGKDYQRQVTGTEKKIWGVLVIGSQSYIFYLDPSDKHVQYSELLINTTGTTMLELLQTVRESIG